MAGRRDYSADLERIERKVDRLTRLAAAVLLFQPVLLVGLIMPDATTQALTCVLLAVLALLALFPNLETKLPDAMRQLGRAFGKARRRTRAFAPGLGPRDRAAA